MLAMLLAMTSTLSSWAIMPVAAVFIARMARSPDTQPKSARNAGELMDGVLVQVALLLEQRRDLLVGARHLDQARHLDHAVHVRLLDRSLHQRGGGVGRRRGPVDGRVLVVAFFLQLLRRREAHQADLAALRLGTGRAGFLD